MIVVHVALTRADGSPTPTDAHRDAHIERALGLRAQGLLIGGGEAPDGRTADLFCRLPRPDDLAPLIEEDPYYRAKVWTAYAPRSFSVFVEPWELPPPVLDGSRRVSIVEGPASDPDMAQLALVELRGTGRLRFGGFFDGSQTLGLACSPDPAEAAGWFAETGVWSLDRLTTRPLLQVL